MYSKKRRIVLIDRGAHPFRKEVAMSPYAVIVVLALLLVFVPISLLPILFDRQDYDSLVERRE
jgi:hypothetical protein